MTNDKQGAEPLALDIYGSLEYYDKSTYILWSDKMQPWNKDIQFRINSVYINNIDSPFFKVSVFQ